MGTKMKDSKKTSSSKEPYKYPTYCGSHASMMESKLNDEWAVLKDDFGLYATKVSSLDDGMADPYRNASPEWREEFLRGLT